MADFDIADKMSSAAAGEEGLPDGAQLSDKIQKIDVSQDTLVSAPEELQQVVLNPEQAATTDLDVPLPARTAASQYEAYLPEGSPEAIAAQGSLSSEAIIGDIQGAVSKNAIASAAVGELDERATTRYQLGQLFKSFEEGSDPPAWASPAMRTVTAMMQARGLGSSSMASMAIVQGIMEAAVPIAKSDADKYANIQLANLSNQQQANLQNALTFAAMDKANLDARMTAAVNNARAFLTIDTQNLSNSQRMAEIDYQGQLQKMLSDQAAENAARAFNAESQAQVDQFFAQLDASIQAANKNRAAAQDQFNVSEANALIQYNADLNNQREQFNVSMQAQIDQSNAQWRRQANTADTAAANEAARIDAQNLFNMSQQAQNNLWNAYRDDVQWALTTAENIANRNHELTMLAMDLEGKTSLLDMELDYNTAASIGGVAYDLLLGQESYLGKKIRGT